MSSTTFIDGATSIVASWLNDVNTTSYTTVPTLGASLTTYTTTTAPAAFVGKTSGTGAAALPVGTTGQRDGTPLAGYLRYNSTLTRFEGYSGTAWGSIGGGATGGGTDTVFYENDRVVNTAYTIASTKGASCVGPLTMNAVVTISGRLVIL